MPSCFRYASAENTDRVGFRLAETNSPKFDSADGDYKYSEY